jgi:hypothetical protein
MSHDEPNDSLESATIEVFDDKGVLLDSATENFLPGERKVRFLHPGERGDDQQARDKTVRPRSAFNAEEGSDLAKGMICRHDKREQNRESRGKR